MTDLAGYKKTYVNHIPFYTNRNAGKQVMDAVIRACPPEKFVIAQTLHFTTKEKTEKKYCKYGSVTPTEFAILCLDNNCIYDVMQVNEKWNKLRIAFDIEKTALSDPLSDCVNLINSKFPSARLNISGSRTAQGDMIKYSYHIVLENYAVSDIKDLAIVQMFSLANKHLGFDPSIYQQKGQYKCINQAKSDNRVQKYISGSEDILDHSLRCNIPDDVMSVEQSLLNEADYETKKKRGRPANKTKKAELKDYIAVKMEISKMDVKIPDGFDMYAATPLEKLKAFPNPPRGDANQRSYLLNMSICRWCKYTGIIFNDFWDWCKQKEDTVERQDKYRKLYANLKSEYVAAGILNKLLILTYGSALLIDKNVKRLKELYNVKSAVVMRKQYINKDDIKKYMKTHSKTILLKLPLGTGKTIATMEYIAAELKKNPNLRILYVTCRIALTREQQDKLPKGFIIYLDASKEVRSIDYNKPLFACSIQSLDLAGTGDDYNMVVFDEVKTVLSSFSGEADCHFHKQNYRLIPNWNMLTRAVQKADKVIAIDVILSNMSVDFFQSLRPNDPPTVITSKKKQSPRSIRLCGNIETFYQQIFNALDRGEKIFVGMSKMGHTSVTNMATVEGLVSTLLTQFPKW